MEPARVVKTLRKKCPDHKAPSICRRSWVNSDTGKHRGMITRTAESLFRALMYLTEKYGRVFPSLEGLAHLAMC
jgi:hypothetical protein